MDGRRFRKWCVFGCLLAATAGCKSDKQPPLGQMPTGTGQQPTIGVPMANSAPAKSFWGKSSAPTPPTAPVEMAADNSKKPASADALAAFSDVRLDAAFDEKTEATSREALLDLARHGYQKALQQEPKNKKALKGMAQFYARVGEKDKAVEMYQKYLKLYPEANVAHEVAVAHARWKDWPGAVAWCEYTLKIDPENRTVKKTKGFCLARAGKWDESFATLCQIMPESQARYKMARVLEHQKQGDASRMQLQLALKADPNYAPAREFLAALEQPQDPNGVRQASDEQPAP